LFLEKEGDVKIRAISERDLATILAALREYQSIMRGDEPSEDANEEIATDGGAFHALTGSEIDGLCDKIHRTAEKAKKRTKGVAR
jgi:hypothetical protein